MIWNLSQHKINGHTYKPAIKLQLPEYWSIHSTITSTMHIYPALTLYSIFLHKVSLFLTWLYSLFWMNSKQFIEFRYYFQSLDGSITNIITVVFRPSSQPTSISLEICLCCWHRIFLVLPTSYFHPLLLHWLTNRTSLSAGYKQLPTRLRLSKWPGSSFQSSILASFDWLLVLLQNEIGWYLSVCTKHNSKWFKDLNIRTNTLNLIEKKIGNNFELIRAGKNPLNTNNMGIKSNCQ